MGCYLFQVGIDNVNQFLHRLVPMRLEVAVRVYDMKAEWKCVDYSMRLAWVDETSTPAPGLNRQPNVFTFAPQTRQCKVLVKSSRGNKMGTKRDEYRDKPCLKT